MNRKNLTIVAFAGLALGAAASATTFNETEPNDNKAGANLISGILVGDTIVGNSIGSSTTVPGAGSADYFRVRTGAGALGIYRNRLIITSAQTHLGSLRGLNQVAGVPGTTDASIQASASVGGVARTNQWYTFGREADIYYRVTGTASTTADYSVAYEQVAVAPTAIAGSFNAGNITITTIGQGHTTDTDFWVYDANFNAIPGYGNDDESVAGGGTGATLQSLLTRNYSAGTYYIAMSNFALTNNQTAAPDDDFQSGALTDFANVLVSSSTSTTASLTFTITDGVTSTQVANVHDAFGVNFFSFTVVPTPGAAALLGLAGLAGVRRRR